jgi:hypothetical protein
LSKGHGHRPITTTDGVLVKTPHGWLIEHPLLPRVYEKTVAEAVAIDQARPQRVLGETGGFCRVCQAIALESSAFRKQAHIIPQALGNRALRTLEECDWCNEHVGSPLESDLVTFFGFGRIMSGYRAGRAEPKIRIRQGGSHLQRRRGRRVIAKVFEDDDSVVMESDLEGKTGVVSAKFPPFRPMNVARAVARMGLLASPRGFLPQMEHMLDWIRRDRILPCVLTRIAAGHPEAAKLTLDVYRRRGIADADWPPWVFAFGFSRFLLIVHLLSPSGRSQERLPTPAFNAPWVPGDDPPGFSRIFVEDDAVVKDARDTIHFTFESRSEGPASE